MSIFIFYLFKYQEHISISTVHILRTLTIFYLVKYLVLFFLNIVLFFQSPHNRESNQDKLALIITQVMLKCQSLTLISMLVSPLSSPTVILSVFISPLSSAKCVARLNTATHLYISFPSVPSIPVRYTPI